MTIFFFLRVPNCRNFKTGVNFEQKKNKNKKNSSNVVFTDVRYDPSTNILKYSLLLPNWERWREIWGLKDTVNLFSATISNPFKTLGPNNVVEYDLRIKFPLPTLLEKERRIYRSSKISLLFVSIIDYFFEKSYWTKNRKVCIHVLFVIHTLIIFLIWCKGSFIYHIVFIISISVYHRLIVWRRKLLT